MVKDISTDTIWGILKTIPDPEIPAISIVDLGIIREVQYDTNSFTIMITPTYSGCPAMYFIKEEIIHNLESQGIMNYFFFYQVHCWAAAVGWSNHDSK